MSTLSKTEILEWMTAPNLNERLIITPLLDKDEQIKDCAIDVRLGNQFIITQKTSFAEMDVSDKNEIKNRIGQYQRKIVVGLKKPFVLHPNQLVLGSTMEYIALPNCLSSYVIGRSSWGRLGLIIATATGVNPGFKGCLTLELENLGEVPIVLYTGIRIAQLIMHTVRGEGKYHSRYRFSVGPEFSKAHEDKEIDFWGPKKY